MRWIRPGSRRRDVVTAGSAIALASILIPVCRCGKETTTPCPEPPQEMREMSQVLSSQSTTGPLGTKPGCCSPLLLGVSPAQMWVSPSPRCPQRGRQGSRLPKFRPTQHCPLLFRFVSLVSLFFFFHFVCHPLKEIWLNLLWNLRSKAVNHWWFPSICVCWYSRKTYKPFLKKKIRIWGRPEKQTSTMEKLVRSEKA